MTEDGPTMLDDEAEVGAQEITGGRDCDKQAATCKVRRMGESVESHWGSKLMSDRVWEEGMGAAVIGKEDKWVARSGGGATVQLCLHAATGGSTHGYQYNPSISTCPALCSSFGKGIDRRTADDWIELEGCKGARNWSIALTCIHTKCAYHIILHKSSTLPDRYEWLLCGRVAKQTRPPVLALKSSGSWGPHRPVIQTHHPNLLDIPPWKPLNIPARRVANVCSPSSNYVSIFTLSLTSLRLNTRDDPPQDTSVSASLALLSKKYSTESSYYS